MTDDDVEKIIKRNMNLQMNLAGIRADFEEAQQRTWVALTDEERVELWNQYKPLHGISEFIRSVEAKLMSKNT